MLKNDKGKGGKQVHDVIYVAKIGQLLWPAKNNRQTREQN